MSVRRDYKEYIGKKFGILTILDILPRVSYQKAIARCQCECGTQKDILINSLLAGKTTSCGCVHRKIISKLNYKHGLSSGKNGSYYIWVAIRQRCNNPNNQDYHNYGGRGIKVCEEWNDYNTFNNWAINNGYKKGLSIERIDFNKNYCPENCMWIPMSEQGKNTRKIIHITIDNQTKSLSEWCRYYNIPIETVRNRHNIMGWDWLKALTYPNQHTGKEYLHEKK